MLSRQEIQDELGLEEVPDDEFMRLLDEVGDEETVNGIPPVEGDGVSPEAIDQAVRAGTDEA